jgi:hypothetical protein
VARKAASGERAATTDRARSSPDTLAGRAVYRRDFRAVLLREDFFLEDFFADDFVFGDFLFEDFFDDFFLGGTLLPSRRASESPMAIACLRLLTFLPDLPLFNVPALRSRIARATFADALREYLRAMNACLPLKMRVSR